MLCLLASPLMAQYWGRGDYPKPSEQSPGAALATLTGTVRGIDRKGITLEGDDSNILDFHFTRKTEFFQGGKKIKPTAIKAGDRAAVDSRKGADGSLEAVVVHLGEPVRDADHAKP